MSKATVVLPRIQRQRAPHLDTAVAVSFKTRDRLRALAAESGLTMARILEILVEQAEVESPRITARGNGDRS